MKTQLENWYEVLKKVMRMWSSGSDILKQANLKSKKAAGQGPTSQSSALTGNDADDFYVFLYDQEDKTFTNQTQLKRGSGRGRGFQKNVIYERVLGFWCFNAGVGFKDIASL